MQRLIASFLVVSIALSASAQDKKASLDIGDPAPVLKPSKWLKGAPVARFEPGKVYIIEFWATWCKPCISAMPHLSELARKYRGQAEVIGVDAFEPNELAKVSAFVKGQGARMDYRVAADAKGDQTWGTWMTAAGEAGIPVSFVVGKNGRIAWIGNPSGLDEVLPKAIAGTLDPMAERARRAAGRDPRNAIVIAMGAGEYATAIQLIDAERARNPEGAGFCAQELYLALAHTSVPKLRQRVQADIEKTRGDFGAYNMATLALLSPGLSAEAYRLGVELVEEALTKYDHRLLLLARGGEMAMKAGDRAKAVELQSEAIKAAEAGSASSERLAELRKDLERYRGTKN